MNDFAKTAPAADFAACTDASHTPVLPTYAPAQAPAPQCAQPAPAYYAPPVYAAPQTNVTQVNLGGIAGRLPRRRQSAMVHFVLFMLTAGIGNVIYAVSVGSENRRRGY